MTVPCDSPQFVLVCDYTQVFVLRQQVIHYHPQLCGHLYLVKASLLPARGPHLPPLQRPETFTPLPPQKPPFHGKWSPDDRLALPQSSWFPVNGLILSPGNPCWRPVVGDGAAFGGGDGAVRTREPRPPFLLSRPEVLAVRTEEVGY